MRWSADGIMVPTCILEVATLHQAVKPICVCGHSAAFNAHGLWWHFKRRGWDDRLTVAGRRFWCRICHSRGRRKVHPIRMELVKASDLDVRLPMPDERTWKAEMRRIR